MSFHITSSSSEQSITKEQLLNSEFAQSLDDKHKQKLESIFEKFNTTKANDGEEEVLDEAEQKSMMDWFQKVAGKNDKITKWEFFKGKRKSATKENFVKGAGIKDYENFLKAYNEAVPAAVQEAKAKAEAEARAKAEAEARAKAEAEAKAKAEAEARAKAEEEAKKAAEEAENAKAAEGVQNPGGVDETDAEDETEEVTEEPEVELPVKPSVIKRISQPRAWYKASPTEALENIDIKEDYTADKVLAKLMAAYDIKSEDVQTDKLKADLIKYNPSIFNKDGLVYADVDWSKLDFPKNAGELYKNGVETPQVERRKVKTSQTGKAQKSEASKAQKAAAAKKGKGTAAQKTDNLPKDIPTLTLRANAPAPQQYADFSSPFGIGIDFRTGANLNLTPLMGIPLVKKYDRNNQITGYSQSRNGKDYYYNENQQLTRIEDKNNGTTFKFNWSESGKLTNYVERGTDKDGVRYYIERNAKSEVLEYITFESGYGHVYRNKDGSVQCLWEFELNSDGSEKKQIKRDPHGKVVEYYVYAEGAWYNPDGTKQE